MTNPNNAVGTNGAFGGRTSVNAFNDDLASYSAGILSGWACEPDSGLTVVLGGDGNTRDVAIAEDNAGNKTTINNISGSPISVTVGAAPNTNSRIDSIVAYVNNPPTGTSTATDNYGACGLIVVAGTASSTPNAPSESTIRASITADGASGTTAYYVVLANITISSGTTDLTSDNISAGQMAQISANNIDFATYSTSEEKVCGIWINGKPIYKKSYVVNIPNSGESVNFEHGISNLDLYIKYEGSIVWSNGYTMRGIPSFYIENGNFFGEYAISCQLSARTVSSVGINYGTAYRGGTAYITLYYTKSN